MFNLRERLASQWATAKKHLFLVLLCVGLLWVVFIVDTALPDSVVDLRKWGIRPRTISGFFSIAAAPFLHVDFWHLLANTLPLVILGWILVVSGRALFVRVCVVTALTSGAGAWAFGQGDLVHEGASGVLFGLLGFLLARGWFARRLSWALTSLGVGLFYLGLARLAGHAGCYQCDQAIRNGEKSSDRDGNEAPVNCERHGRAASNASEPAAEHGKWIGLPRRCDTVEKQHYL